MTDSTNKIILVADNFPYGGATANFLRNFALTLAVSKNNVEVIIPHGSYYGVKIESENSRKGFIEGVPYKYLGFLNHPRNYAGKLIDNILSLIIPGFYLTKLTFRKKLDFIIVYNTTFLTTLNYVLLKTFLHKKLVIILPEFYEKPKSGILSLDRIKWFSFYVGINHLVKYADGFIVLSCFLSDFVKNKIKTKKAVFIMPNLTDPEKFELNGIEPFVKNKTTIGYTGTPSRKDGILDLIKCFSVLHKNHPYTHLLVIGDNTNATTVVPELREYAAALEIADDITFTGLVSHIQIPALLNACQILTLTRPSGIFAEAGFPTKLGEYFACKKPVVITKVGDIPKYFTDGEQAILVEPENIESIVAGFERLLNDKALSEKVSLNGYQWMNEFLNYKNQSIKLSSFLSDLNG